MKRKNSFLDKNIMLSLGNNSQDTNRGYDMSIQVESGNGCHNSMYSEKDWIGYLNNQKNLFCIRALVNKK